MSDNKEMRLDTRVMPHALRRGSITHDEVKQHMADLPDEADEAVECETKFDTPFARRVQSSDPS
jgi:hypothetical protein